MEDEKKPVTTPLEQFFNQESKFNELQIPLKTQLDTISPKKLLGTKQELNKDPITTSPKPNMKDLVTYFIDPKLKLLGTFPFPPLDDGLSPEQGCEKTFNGMENSETWCGKNQTRCYVVQVVYLEKLEMTMWKMEIRKGKLVIVSPSHLEEKRHVYTGNEKSNTTESNKPGVNNKKMIIDNHYDDLWRIDYENGVMKNQWNW